MKMREENIFLRKFGMPQETLMFLFLMKQFGFPTLPVLYNVKECK